MNSFNSVSVDVTNVHSKDRFPFLGIVLSVNSSGIALKRVLKMLLLATCLDRGVVHKLLSEKAKTIEFHSNEKYRFSYYPFFFIVIVSVR